MDHQRRVYDNIFELMPDEENPTPLVRINRLNPAPNFPLFAKLEWMNPFGSVKDRAAWEMLRDLEQRGEIGGPRGIGRSVTKAVVNSIVLIVIFDYILTRILLR